MVGLPYSSQAALAWKGREGEPGELPAVSVTLARRGLSPNQAHLTFVAFPCLC
jgi:hypothetical protein